MTRRIVTAICVFVSVQFANADDALVDIGVAKVDITPDYPIRLSGYGNRRSESEGVAQRIWAKGLAIGSDADDAAVLVTVDNCAVPENVAEEVAARLQRKAGITRERFALSFSHTHTGPCLTGAIPYLFSTDIPPAHQKNIDRYTRELTGAIERVALEALAARRPGRLAWAQGKATFAANRRTAGGPVDHDLPVLRVTDPEGELRVVLTSYACHCTTLGGDFNQICGDWATYAQDQIEANHPGAIAMVAIGCGADANPQPRTGLKLAEQHGKQIADEVERLLAGKLTPVAGKLACRFQRVTLPLEESPGEEVWQQRAKTGGIVGYHARKVLQRLADGEKLPADIAYPVQTWAFGDDLAMVFLAGEVVVDYSLRIKRQFDGSRLWVNSYSNAAPSYVPSRRVLREGGYEAGDSDAYYAKAARFTPAVEDLIVGTVQKLLPRAFYSDALKAEFPPPRSPQDSLQAIRLEEGLEIELVAAEPVVVDPVALDFGPDGKLWVVEMHDYPSGLGGHFEPGGRVKYLEDLDGDGAYERSTLFLDGLPFPTGVMAWRKGVLVCAAPDIVYAEDTDGDGKADLRKVLYTAFATDNYQTRVNGLVYGLDNWVHGSPGLLDATVTSNITGKTVRLGARSFRIQPDTGAIEPTSGRTQHGRVRDDWGNWFGNHNSALIFHYPLPDRYLRRNPYVAGPAPDVHLARSPGWNRVYPISRTLQRFNDPSNVNQVTSACSPLIYRGALLGPELAGDAFVCEAVHNLVTRLKVSPEGVTFTGHRADGEETSEFLSSTDNWSRFVQLQNGPGGALWLADMYRFVIEHPRWITAERLAQLDVRAGSQMGRIYRIYPKGKRPGPNPRFDLLDNAALVSELESENGWRRDMAQRLLVEREAGETAGLLERTVTTSSRATARLHALCALDGLGALEGGVLVVALGDSHPQVRRHAVRLAEPWLRSDAAVRAAVLRLADDDNAVVRLQVACSLGEFPSAETGPVLARLALRDADDPYMVAGALSSAGKKNVGGMIETVLAVGEEPPLELLNRLAALAAAVRATEGLQLALEAMTRPKDGRYAAWQLTGLAQTLEAMHRHNVDLRALGQTAIRAADRVFYFARRQAVDSGADAAGRAAALGLLGRQRRGLSDDISLLGGLLTPQEPSDVQSAAVAALGRMPRRESAEALLAGWRSYGPALRSQVLQTLLQRDMWVPVLLEHVAKQEVLPSEINAAHRQRLLEHGDAVIGKRAAALLAAGPNRDRGALIEQYLAVASQGGDATRGAETFKNKCGTCHKVGYFGQPVGPDLDALTDKSPSALVTAVIDPNQAVEPKFVNYAAVTQQGVVLSGILVSESGASITLVDQEGKQHAILRSELETLQSTGKSLMPEGLEKDLTPQDLADVIRFVLSVVGTGNFD